MGHTRSRATRRLIIAGMALAAVLVLAFTGFVLTRQPAPVAASKVIPTGKPIKAAFVPQLLVLGDSFTGGSDMGGFKDDGWPALVQSGYTKDGARLQLNLLGRGGAGYVTKGIIHETFGQSYAGNAFEDQDVVVVFGGLNDASAPADTVGTAAGQLYAAMLKNSPNAKLIVVGPAWPNDTPIPNMFDVRDAIKAAALHAGATFIDPIAEGWFTGEDTKLIGRDNTHPTDAGHAYMAKKLSKPILDAVAKSAAANK
ncbi:SGNH/GDSL hydrolase family protein [Arthrobacter sp. IA7]|uniref:SGNH/GDSL hydrolase family protein n=1 Tax=Arthrobacter ipis TaxID=2716202 RepID=UPI001685C1B3|nr:SGNH/GDSL hydrolase family protein [Arthrobacter ipis]MBD1541846.1 SGNH/GDSL hydrolase family protein [Arthrobacter ipis]